MAVSALALAIAAGTASADDRDNDGGRDLRALGVTADLRLFSFETDDPSETRRIGTIALTGDTSLLGIDFRPATGVLYGVGNGGGLYTINPRTAAATKVDSFDIAPVGASFGVDFNPAADALRIVSDTGQNLRHAFASNTTFSDTPLTYAGVAATGVTGAAYTNNDADANTATTLFDIDSTLDQVAIQSPANSGMLAPTGKLGVITTANVGFDIYSAVRKGTTTDNDAFASLTVDGRTRLYQIDLLTGRAMKVGSFPSGSQPIDIAIPLAQR
jgi:hypothetical protein